MSINSLMNNQAMLNELQSQLQTSYGTTMSFSGLGTTIAIPATIVKSGRVVTLTLDMTTTQLTATSAITSSSQYSCSPLPTLPGNISIEPSLIPVFAGVWSYATGGGITPANLYIQPIISNQGLYFDLLEADGSGPYTATPSGTTSIYPTQGVDNTLKRALTITYISSS
jgi:hypothetical protein